MTREQVQQVKDQNWSFFQKNCRRLVPRPDELLMRFNRVIEEFAGCVDNDSREVILRPKATKAVRLLRKHIVEGCLSDPAEERCTTPLARTGMALPTTVASEAPTMSR